MRRLFTLTLLLGSLLYGSSTQRCQSYTQEVRRAHWTQFGVDYPYWYGVGQLHQESGCRDIVSRDGVGSQGLAQITWRWHKETLQKHGIKSLDAIPDQLKAQAILMRQMWVQKYGLWVTYQVYNGGGYVLKEINRAGIENWELAKAQCRRGQSCFTYPSGKMECVSNCEINYDYSVKVYRYGKLYAIGSDQIKFW